MFDHRLKYYTYYISVRAFDRINRYYKTIKFNFNILLNKAQLYDIKITKPQYYFNKI